MHFDPKQCVRTLTAGVLVMVFTIPTKSLRFVSFPCSLYKCFSRSSNSSSLRRMVKFANLS